MKNVVKGDFTKTMGFEGIINQNKEKSIVKIQRQQKIAVLFCSVRGFDGYITG